jgi:hypothetical protein
LAHPSQVLTVDKEPDAAELLFAEDTDDHVGLAHGAVRVLLERLVAGVVPLQAETSDACLLPHPHDAGAVSRRLWHILFQAVDGFSCVHVRVCRCDGKGLLAKGAEELDSEVRRWVSQFAKDVRSGTVDVNRIRYSRSEDGSRVSERPIGTSDIY